MKSTYSEPTVVWHLRHSDGRVARATLIPHGFGCSLVWWINDAVEGADEFADWAGAIQHADRLRAELTSQCWSEDSKAE